MEKKCLLLLESPRDEDQRKISRTEIAATVVSAGARPLLEKVQPDHPEAVKLRKASGMAGRFIPALNPLSSPFARRPRAPFSLPNPPDSIYPVPVLKNPKPTTTF